MNLAGSLLQANGWSSVGSKAARKIGAQLVSRKNVIYRLAAAAWAAAKILGLRVCV